MLSERRTKIVATIGPAIDSREGLRKAILAGMNVARLNFSHGDHATHERVVRDLRSLSQEMRAPVSILQDLQGPKIRVGKFENGGIELKEGNFVTITVRDVVGMPGLIPSDFKPLMKSLKPGLKVMFDDGLLELVVEEVLDETDARLRVIYGGVLKDRKGMNVPGAELAVECLTEKDLRDLEFGIRNEVDYIALSFVRRADDIRQLRELLQKAGSQARIVAKIEMLEALDNLEEIVRLSDAVMVARGDLAVEIGQTRLPMVQKHLVSLANNLGRPVITATQMLDSMTGNPRPTRAEITDVANAVLDGSDALMLSAESASGKFPFRCIRTMHDIILEVEKNGNYSYDKRMADRFTSVADAIGAASALSAMKLDAAAIVCLTTSGKTATIISGFRPKAKIVAVTHILPTLNRLELAWGIQTHQIKPYQSSQEAMAQIEKLLLEFGIVRSGDKVVLTLGEPVMERGTTNSLRVYTIGAEDIMPLPDSEIPTRCRRTTEVS